MYLKEHNSPVCTLFPTNDGLFSMSGIKGFASLFFKVLVTGNKVPLNLRDKHGLYWYMIRHN
jgi:hypothetical protein